MSNIVRNALSLAVSQAATLSVALVSLIIVPRYLGEVEFGQFSFAVTYVGFFGLLGLFGTNTYLTKAVARDHSLVGTYVLNTLVMKIAIGFALGLSSVVLAMALSFDEQLVAIIAASSVAMFIVLLNDTVTGAMNGLERMARPAFWAVVYQVVAALLGLTVILLNGGVVAYAWALVPAATIPLGMNLLSLRDELRHQRIDWTLWGQILLGGLPFLAIAAVHFVYGSADIIMLGWLADDATVGWYALAYRWIALPALLAITALTALFPTLAQHGAAVTERFVELSNRAIRFVVFVSLPIAVGIGLVAGDVIALFYPGDRFNRSIVLMQILAIHIPIVVVDMVLGLVLLASDRQRQWLMVGTIAALANPALNLVAIPIAVDRYGNGAIGAAVTTVVTEFGMLVGALWFRPRGVLDRPTARFVGRVVVATAVIPLALSPIWNSGLLLKMAIGGSVYVVASILVQTLRDSGVMSLAQPLTRRSNQVPSGKGSDV